MTTKNNNNKEIVVDQKEKKRTQREVEIISLSLSILNIFNKSLFCRCVHVVSGCVVRIQLRLLFANHAFYYYMSPVCGSGRE